MVKDIKSFFTARIHVPTLVRGCKRVFHQENCCPNGNNWSFTLLHWDAGHPNGCLNQNITRYIIQIINFGYFQEF